MNDNPSPASTLPGIEGSLGWQVAFFAVCGLLLLWQIFSGRRQGPIRGLVNLAALVLAYCAGFFGGPLVAPLLRGVVTLPDFALSVIGGAGLGIIVYVCVSGIGAVLFRKTGDQESGVLRFVYGLSGAVIGLATGCLLIWVLLMGVGLLGTVAENRLEAENEAARELGTVDPGPAGRGVGAELPSPPKPQTAQAAQARETAEFVLRLNRSVQLGLGGAVVDQVDVVPDEVHRVLAKVSRTVANPVSVTRFMDFPGAKELSEHAKVQALRDDPEISQMAMAGQYFVLLTHQKLIDAANDPVLAAELKKFDLEKALDYALARPAERQSGQAGARLR